MSVNNHDDGGRDGHEQGHDVDGVAGGRPDQDGDKKSGLHQGGDKVPYQVGYKRPPKHSRVVEGQVLNPKGRPKGSKNKPKEVSMTSFRKMILKEARQSITLNEAKGPVTLTKFETVFRSLFHQGVKGNARAALGYIRLTGEADREHAEERHKVLLDLGEYWIRYEELRRRHGKVSKDLLDPNGIIYGTEGVLGYREAASEEDKVLWQGQRAEWQADLAALQSEREDAKGRKRARLESKIAEIERLIEVANNALAGVRDSMWILDQGFAARKKAEQS